MLKEFKKFAMRGNVVDLAVGIIVGSAFNKIVNSLVNDMIMPTTGILLGKVDFTNLFVALDGNNYNTLAEAQAAGVPTINYGLFLNSVADFVIMAFVTFVLVRQINRLRQRDEDKPKVPSSKECPYCLTTIALGATRCPNCTSCLE